MHIKQVIISGFRSFRSQGSLDSFSPSHNVIVGRNGSGKSNLFDAIQFALLSPKFSNLRQEDRAALLHEGSGSAVMSAFVEVVFDNSDGRLAVDGDEVVLRRTIGLKKDEFFLNRKRVQKSEVASLLESAGFSKSNPYYIVQQGKVNALCVMKDGERLALLKEVAGTTVYDEKRLDSLKQMEDNSGSRLKINEVITYIEDRLADLTAEKEELTAYQKLDRSRRALEYTLYDKELGKARQALEDVEHMRAADADAAAARHDEARGVAEGIATVEREAKQAEFKARRVEKDLEALGAENTQAVTRRAQLELEVADLKAQGKSDAEHQKVTKESLDALEADISRAKARLKDDVNPAYDAVRAMVNALGATRDRNAEAVKLLYAKQGRGKAYATAKERDEYLRGASAELATQAKERREQVASAEDNVAARRRAAAQDEERLEAAEEDARRKQQLLLKLSSALAEKAQERNAKAEERRARWREAEDVTDRLAVARADLKRAEADRLKAMPRATALGIDSIREIVEEEGIKGCYGTVVDNLSVVDDKFRQAVEVAAGNALFHFIVDTDETAALLMDKLEKKKGGRVTFMPLNRLRYDAGLAYPESNDVVPIIKRCIKFKPEVKGAMAQIFGRKLLAKNLDVAQTWSRNADMDAVTMDGDEVNRKGGMHGGFMEPSKGKLAAHDAATRAKDAVSKLEAEQRDLQEKAAAADQAVANVQGEMQKLEAKRANVAHVLEQTAAEAARTRTRVEAAKDAAEAAADALPRMRSDAASLEEQAAKLAEEIGTPLAANLSAAERATLNSLNAQLLQLDAELEGKASELDAVAAERERLQSLLRDNLLRRRLELLESLSGAGAGAGTGRDVEERKAQLESKLSELDAAERLADAASARVAAAKAAGKEARDALVKARAELEELKAKDLSNQQGLEEAAESAERLLNKRSMCVSKRELYMRKIQELGSLPSGELSQYANMSVKDLMKALDTCNKNLKKYSHVNKKAVDMWINFEEQKDELTARKAELDVGAKKIKELIESLDKKKDEAISRTFRGVAAHFKDVFKELCPEGAGELVMRTSMDEAAEEAAADGDDMSSEAGSSVSAAVGRGGKKGGGAAAASKAATDVSLYRGVQIRVRFTAQGESYIMSQLSGGQKALVAMALIFAIQRSDPAPFYLFDELDQALDSTHRAAVAALIARQAASEEMPTQFITSTFRPELVQVASRCYGISLQNKVSNVHLLTKRDALSFVANLMSEEEALGDVSGAGALSAAAEQRREMEGGDEGDDDYRRGGAGEGGDDDMDEYDDNDDDDNDEENRPTASNIRGAKAAPAGKTAAGGGGKARVRA